MSLNETEIAEIVARVGKPRARNNGRIELDLDRVRAMKEAGFSTSQIGDYFGVSRITVYRRLHNTDRSMERVKTEIGKRLEVALTAHVTPQA